MNAFKKFVGDDGGSSSSGTDTSSIGISIPGITGNSSSSSSSSSATNGLPKLPNILGGNKSNSAAETASATVSNATGGMFGEQDNNCGLTKQQRMIGFASCFGIGMLISLLSTMNIAKPTSFALLYSLGNMVSFLSTGFLVGPKRQCKYACERKRIIATLIFLVSMICTLLVALLYKGSGSIALCIFLIIIQFCALVWYTASYIPFAQQAISGFMKSCFGRAAGATAG